MKTAQLFLFLLAFSICTTALATELESFLNTQSSIQSVEKITGNSFFDETFKIMVRQPLDHSDTSKGFFLQRVFIADKGKNTPVVLITEGYTANYAASPRYLNELSPMLNASQICIEHRYFGQSWPDSLNWDYLTVKNAAGDHHCIVELFRKYYKNKWINTGISKGGQTAVYHRTYYPEDVDLTVAYVAPLNFAVEDKRHRKFLKTKPGTAEQRKRIEDFQIAMLKARKEIVPKLIEYSKQKNFTYRIPINEVFDYWVLEFPFALWQYGRSPDKIPASDADPREFYDYMMNVSEPSYFSVEAMEGIKSFYVQAARELGYYAYDIKPLKKFLTIKSARNYLEKIFLPSGLKIKYKQKTALEVKKFIKTTDKNILFIYGQFDPWFASSFQIPRKENLLKVAKPGGSHSSRIQNLPEKQQKLVRNMLEKSLGFDIDIN
ncbi:S28 family serine protease [Maribellus maritimus]|uniref:S28 family serine protease n=1 Tax=Maribellus maritimus TaxID=2870838 RepID=UPI001EEB274D|nr:S28 family serine protease [Maribellus maritimus]MCG6187205.1 peptidase [Maribellus maritimus]